MVANDDRHESLPKHAIVGLVVNTTANGGTRVYAHTAAQTSWLRVSIDGNMTSGDRFALETDIRCMHTCTYIRRRNTPATTVPKVAQSDMGM
jgi:hypothetical protein